MSESWAHEALVLRAANRDAIEITRVEPLLVEVPYDHGAPRKTAWPLMSTLFVKVETDAGLIGWGEAFGFGASPLTAVAIRDTIAPLCRGRDPRDPRTVLADLQRALHNLGRYGPLTFGLSGVDIALWDIAGKAAGRPVHALLGGAVRDRIPIYASLLPYHDPELCARNARAAVERGYRSVKLHEKDEASVAAARRAVGDDVALMVDVNCAWSPNEALAMATRLKPYGLRWLEEPVWPPEDFDALARVGRESGVPTAAGENACTPADIRRMLRERVVDVVQPSVTKIGGITELQRLVADAAACGATLVPHSPYLGPGLVATMHVLAAMLTPCVGERFYVELEASPIASAIEVVDGCLRVGAEPGLGFDVDQEVIARYRVA
jgi:L-alanine-DL-glutamate epimerase-like enolase superfamily enzyme